MLFFLEDEKSSIVADELCKLTFFKDNIDCYIFGRNNNLENISSTNISIGKFKNKILNFMAASLFRGNDVLICSAEASLGDLSKSVFNKRLFISEDGWIYLSARSKYFFSKSKLLKTEIDVSSYSDIFQILNKLD